MELTEHGLKKPDNDDFYSIQDFNENTTVIEAHLSDKESHVISSEIAYIVEPETLIQIGSGDNTRTIWGKIKKSIGVLLDHIGKVATATTAGHIKIGAGLQMSSGTASVKIANNLTTNDNATALSAAMGVQLNTNLATTNSNVAGKAPTAHASTGVGYGIGNASNYGHVKLSDTYSASVGGASSALGASQNALYNLYKQTSMLYNGTTNTLVVAPNTDATQHTVQLTLPSSYSSILGIIVISYTPELTYNTIAYTRNVGLNGLLTYHIVGSVSQYYAITYTVFYKP